MIACPPSKLEDLSTVLVTGCETMKNESKATISKDHWHSPTSNTGLDISKSLSFSVRGCYYYHQILIYSKILLTLLDVLITARPDLPAKSSDPALCKMMQSSLLRELFDCAEQPVVSLTFNVQSASHTTMRAGQLSTPCHHDDMNRRSRRQKEYWQILRLHVCREDIIELAEDGGSKQS